MQEDQIIKIENKTIYFNNTAITLFFPINRLVKIIFQSSNALIKRIKLKKSPKSCDKLPVLQENNLLINNIL